MISIGRMSTWMNKVMSVKVLCKYKNLFKIISKYSSAASIVFAHPCYKMKKYTQRDKVQCQKWVGQGERKSFLSPNTLSSSFSTVAYCLYFCYQCYYLYWLEFSGILPWAMWDEVVVVPVWPGPFKDIKECKKWLIVYKSYSVSFFLNQFGNPLGQ